MGISNLWPLVLSVSIPMVIALYILKRKYKEKEISSSLLWMEAYKNSIANTPWEKLKVNIMMFLQIIVLLLLIFALMNPFLNIGGKTYKNLIVVIDNTASMSTLYKEDKTRLNEAKRIVKEYISSIKEDTENYIISYNGSGNYNMVSDLDDINQGYGSGAVSDVLSYVKALGEGLEGYEVLVITDKNLDLGEINGTVVSLANSGENASITNLAHKFTDDGIKIIATIKNNGDSDYSGDFSLYGEDNLLEVKTVELTKGESITLNYTYEDLNYKYLKGELSKNDLVSGDNTYYDVIGSNKEKKILLITEKNVFLEKSFSNLENVSLYKTNDVNNIPNEEYDLYVFDNVTPKIMPKSGGLLFINPESNEFFNLENISETKEGMSVEEELPTYLKNMSFVISDYKKIEVPYYGKALLKAGNDTVAFVGEVDGRSIGAIGFDIHNSDIALKKEFPVFMYELEEMMINSGALYKNNFTCGDEIVVKGSTESEEIKITTPNKETTKINRGESYENYSSLGIYKLKEVIGEEDKEELFSINYPSEESIVDNEVVGENSNEKEQSKILKKGLSLSPIILLGAIVLLLIEWILYLKGN